MRPAANPSDAHRRHPGARARLLRAPLLALLLACLGASALPAGAQAAGTGFCTPPVANPVACENSLPGDPPSDWQVERTGDPSIQGFATAQSVTPGSTIQFKIKTPASQYHIDILRLGYYQSNGARKIAAGLRPSATLPQTQPACLTDSSTGLIDCGNWGVSASWTVPADAVSGVYVAHLVRDDTGGDSQIVFVVRDDTSHAGIVVQTSDATWQAYNDYGGNSLYSCTVACPPGNPLAYKAAYAVSYNRPSNGSFGTDGGLSYFYYAEYQLIRFLEANGYPVTYVSESDVDRDGAALLGHRAFVSSGHDEYWSSRQRANVEAARDAGVGLAFLSGNEVFWKTRWLPSTASGTSTPYRTLVSYKDTHFTGPTDPQEWTGTWADPRFSPPADGGRPQNALTGQYFTVNAGTTDIQVPAAYAKLRFWRNTAVARLTGSQTLTLAPGTGTLGYEWDEDLDNGFRPAGAFRLSSTAATGLQRFTDYGSTVADGSSATHHLVEYRAPSGALVFGAGTVQWAWGLDRTNGWSSATTDPSGNPPDANIQQATVNLLADMGVQPDALQPGLVAATASTDTTAPTSTITSPAAGSTVADGTRTTISGTASDAGGGVVAGVEVSTDGGTTWHPADGTGSWTYTWDAHGSPTATIRSRAVDDSGNRETPSAGRSIAISCPCTIWGSGVTPDTPDGGDGNAVELGVRFRSDRAGVITGIRYYRSAANTGTHVGSLWTAGGTLLASATFTGETSTGWQKVTFPTAVPIDANTTYVAAYHAPNGHYAATPGAFWQPPLSPVNLDSPPLHALPDAGTTTNGLYLYTSTSAFPTETYDAENYWVDPIYAPADVPAPPGTPTGVSATAGSGSATVTWTTPSSGGTPTGFTVTPYAGTAAQTPVQVGGTATTATVTGLTAGVSYTFRVTAANAAGSGTPSSPSNAVTPTAVSPPGAPTAVAAVPATASAGVRWTAPATTGGGAITGYAITPYDGATALPTVRAAATATSVTVPGLANGTAYTFRVAATNAAGTGPASAASTAVVPRDTIFDLATPPNVDSGDPGPVVLGVKFTSDVAGTVTGIRFYKSAANTGTHIGSLWTATGTLLATATFTNETTTGWQTATFSTPVAVTAGTTYVAGYLAPNGRYAYTSPAFSLGAVDNAPLHALADGAASHNGVYAYSATSTFPTSTFNATNYWVDVLLQPAPAAPPPTTTTTTTPTTTTPTPPVTTTTTAPPPTVPGAPTAVTGNPAGGSVRVDWAAPASDGGSPITGYVVTPFLGSSAQTPITVIGTTTVVTGLVNGGSYTFRVAATNAAGTGPASAASTAVVPRDTIFDLATPPNVDSGDPGPVVLGVKFTSDVAGTVTGIRFYKSAANTGTHIGSLWTATGTLLATATFTNETTTGWQRVDFATPVAISANTRYVAAYRAPAGHYSYTSPAFSLGAVDNPPLHAVANSVSPNGVYAYSSANAFPTSTFNSSNYWVDPMFVPPAG